MCKLIFGAVPALILMSTSALAAPTWTVSEVSGNVQLMENGRTRAASKGALLASGATITTAAGARAVIVRGQEFVVISPATRLRVPAAQADNGIVQMLEDWGSALFRIEKKSTPHFGVQTPYLAAVVKGTTFTVTVGRDDANVHVSEGAVEVSTLDGGAADLVRPGATATVGRSDLHKLTIKGSETKILRSRQAPAAGPVAAPVLAARAPAVAPAEPVRIAFITEEPFSLADATGGMLEGGSAAELIQADVIAQNRAAERSERNGGGRPGDAGKPDGTGKPDDAGKPDGTGKPDDAGKPDGTGKPDDAGKPDGTGKPDDAGKPDDPGKPGGEDKP